MTHNGQNHGPDAGFVSGDRSRAAAALHALS